MMRSSHLKLGVKLLPLAMALAISGCGGGGASEPAVTPSGQEGEKDVLSVPKETVPKEPVPAASGASDAYGVPDASASEYTPAKDLTPVNPADVGASGPTNGVLIPITEPPPPLAVTIPDPVLPPAPPGTAQAREGKMGANIGNVRYYTRGMEYNDLMRQAGGLGVVGGSWLGAAKLDADGWPSEDFSVTLMGGQKNTPNLDGVYTIVFKETALSRTKGQLRVSLLASQGTLSAPVYDAPTGMTVISLTFPKGGDQMILSFAGTNGGVRDLKVLRPGVNWRAADIPVFTDVFLKTMEPMSTLRYMDWTATNNFNFPARWADRPTLQKTRAHQNLTPGAHPGVPWERAIEMANATNTDMWVTVPTRADANYYTELAKLLKAKLKPNLKVYVEYSNEVWNGQFTQYHYMVGDTLPANDKYNVGNAVLEEANNPNLRWDETPSKPLDALTLGTRIYAERLFRISEAFRAVFGDAEMITRVRPVLAWQVGTSGLMDRMIAYARRVYPARTVDTYLYAISTAPYFGMGSTTVPAPTTADPLKTALKKRTEMDGWTVDQVITFLNDTLLTLDTTTLFENSAYVAKKHGLKWLAYEGGSDTFGPGSLTAKAQAHRDPRMKDLCLKNIRDFQKAGGDLFMYFTSGVGDWTTQYGAWPLEEYLVPGKLSYKSQCVATASYEAPQTPTLRHQVGVAFDAAELVGSYLAVGSPGYLNNRGWWVQDQLRDYVVTSPTAACYSLKVMANFGSGGTRPKFDVLINSTSKLAGIPINPIATPAGTYGSTTLGTVCLDAGVNVLGLKLSTVSGSGTMDKILLEPVSVP